MRMIIKQIRLRTSRFASPVVGQHFRRCASVSALGTPGNLGRRAGIASDAGWVPELIRAAICRHLPKLFLNCAGTEGAPPFTAPLTCAADRAQCPNTLRCNDWCVNFCFSDGGDHPRELSAKTTSPGQCVGASRHGDSDWAQSRASGTGKYSKEANRHLNCLTLRRTTLFGATT